MNPKPSLAIVGMCGLFAAGVSCQNSATHSARPIQPAQVHSYSVASAALSSQPTARPSDIDSAAKLSPTLAASQVAEKAKREHILPASGPVMMETPPPSLRVETKAPAPAAGYVWIPGHWKPVKGEWEWTPGEWGIPPTAVSVWIDGKYDSKTNQWSAGYWQPDRPQSYEQPEVPQKHPPLPAKF